MSGQLVHLVTMAATVPHVSIRVLPLSAGPHPAALGAFAVLDFPEGGAHPEPSTVYSEGATGALYLDKESELATYEDIWTRLDTLVLDDGQSSDLIAALAKEYAE